MRLREFRRGDAGKFFQLLKSQFPEEEAVLGMRPEGFEAVVRRLYRPGLRAFLGLLRAFHRSPFHLYVVEEAESIAGMTLLTFTARTGFLSTVVVDPPFRRRGFARALIETARREASQRRRPYVALRVLESNAPARELYASAGYRQLDRQVYAVHDGPSSLARGPTAPTVRPFRPSDAVALAEIADRTHAETVRTVLPVRPRDLVGGGWADRLFGAETAAWVVDRGHGPEAHVAATSTATTDAAHLSTPIVGESVEPSLAVDLLHAAGAWLAERKPLRIVTSVSEDDRRAHRALEEAGFHDAFALFTLYRSSA